MAKKTAVKEVEIKAETKVIKSEHEYIENARTLPRSAMKIYNEHLRAILPLRNPSHARRTNLVMKYILDWGEKNNRPFEVDKYGNIYHIPENGVKRAIVAHTDAVNQQDGDDVEPIQLQGGFYYPTRRRRPIGGDDKVGVAIALTIGEFAPEFSLIFTADEEVGLSGAKSIELPIVHELAVQCDRKGYGDLVDQISSTRIASKACSDLALSYLPHRTAVNGGGTDVLALVERKLVNNAFNMSCGYFNSHTSNEGVSIGVSRQALEDAWVLLMYLPKNMPATDISTYVYRNDYAGGYRGESDYYQNRVITPPKALGPTNSNNKNAIENTKQTLIEQLDQAAEEIEKDAEETKGEIDWNDLKYSESDREQKKEWGGDETLESIQKELDEIKTLVGGLTIEQIQEAISKSHESGKLTKAESMAMVRILGKSNGFRNEIGQHDREVDKWYRDSPTIPLLYVFRHLYRDTIGLQKANKAC